MVDPLASAEFLKSPYIHNFSKEHTIKGKIAKLVRNLKLEASVLKRTKLN